MLIQFKLSKYRKQLNEVIFYSIPGAVQMMSKVTKEMDLQLSEDSISLVFVETANKGGLQMKISIERVIHQIIRCFFSTFN